MAEENTDAVVPPGITEHDLAHAAALRIIDAEEPKEAKDPAPAPTDKAEPAPTEEPKSEEPQPSEEAKTPEPPKAEEPPAPKFKVKLRDDDGTERELEVDEHELKNGYIRQQVYKQKTAALAKEREGVRDEVKKQVEPQLKEYSEKLALYQQALWKALAPEIQNTDWNKLAQDNPAEWTQRMQAVQNVNGVLQAIQGEQEKLVAKQRADQQEALKRSVKDSIATLRERVPNWNNDLYNKVLKAGVEHYRFSAEEVNAITDPRAIEALNDARLYRELQQSKPQVTKKVAEVPKVVKPGAIERTDTGREQWNKGLSQLKQRGGKDRDAFALAAQLIEREGIKN